MVVRGAEIFDFQSGMRLVDQEGFQITPTSPLEVKHNLVFENLINFENSRFY